MLHRGASGLDPTSTQPARRVVGRRRGGRRRSGGLAAAGEVGRVGMCGVCRDRDGGWEVGCGLLVSFSVATMVAAVATAVAVIVPMSSVQLQHVEWVSFQAVAFWK